MKHEAIYRKHQGVAKSKDVKITLVGNQDLVDAVTELLYEELVLKKNFIRV